MERGMAHDPADDERGQGLLRADPPGLSRYCRTFAAHNRTRVCGH